MNFLTLNDLDSEGILDLIDKAIEIKKNPGKYTDSLKNKTLAMLFQKSSTRTRCSFEAGMTQLGGHAMYLDWITTHLKKTALKDEIKCIARYADIIMARVYKHEDLITMAENSDVPVINALCDKYHPCQAMADLMTIKEKKPDLKDIKIAYLGDGNNVCNSLIIICAKLGIEIAVAIPEGYEPSKDAIKIGKESGMLELTQDPEKAAENADFVYTDTWVSMGQEEEKEKKLKIFKPYQLTKKLLNDAYFLHCLPAYRGLEVTDEVMDSEQSLVFDQAENRLHVQKAIMLKLLNKI